MKNIYSFFLVTEILKSLNLQCDKKIIKEKNLDGLSKSVQNLYTIEKDVAHIVKTIHMQRNDNIKPLLIELYWYFLNYIKELEYTDLQASKLIGYYREYVINKNLIRYDPILAISYNQPAKFIDAIHNLIKFMEEIHTNNEMNMISNVEFKEEKENIRDFIEVEKRLIIFIHELESEDNVDQIMSCLIYIHLEILNYIWHIEQINEVIKKIISFFDQNIVFELLSNDIKH